MTLLFTTLYTHTITHTLTFGFVSMIHFHTAYVEYTSVFIVVHIRCFVWKWVDAMKRDKQRTKVCTHTNGDGERQRERHSYTYTQTYKSWIMIHSKYHIIPKRQHHYLQTNKNVFMYLYAPILDGPVNYTAIIHTISYYKRRKWKGKKWKTFKQ